MKLKRWIVFFVTSLLLIAILAGCSDSSTNTAIQPLPSPPSITEGLQPNSSNTPSYVTNARFAAIIQGYKQNFFIGYGILYFWGKGSWQTVNINQFIKIYPIYSPLITTLANSYNNPILLTGDFISDEKTGLMYFNARGVDSQNANHFSTKIPSLQENTEFGLSNKSGYAKLLPLTGNDPLAAWIDNMMNVDITFMLVNRWGTEIYSAEQAVKQYDSQQDLAYTKAGYSVLKMYIPIMIEGSTLDINNQLQDNQNVTSFFEDKALGDTLVFDNSFTSDDIIKGMSAMDNHISGSPYGPLGFTIGYGQVTLSSYGGGSVTMLVDPDYSSWKEALLSGKYPQPGEIWPVLGMPLPPPGPNGQPTTVTFNAWIWGTRMKDKKTGKMWYQVGGYVPEQGAASAIKLLDIFLARPAV